LTALRKSAWALWHGVAIAVDALSLPQFPLGQMDAGAMYRFSRRPRGFERQAATGEVRAPSAEHMSRCIRQRICWEYADYACIANWSATQDDESPVS